MASRGSCRRSVDLDELNLQREAFLPPAILGHHLVNGRNWLALCTKAKTRNGIDFSTSGNEGSTINQFESCEQQHLPKTYAIVWSLTVEPQRVEAYAEEMKDVIRGTYTKTLRRAKTWKRASHELSCTMAVFLPAVRRLAHMLYGQACHKLAVNVFMFMASKSIPPKVLPIEDESYCMERLSDTALDEELVNPFTANREWLPTLLQLKDLVADNQLLEQHQIYSYLPRFRALLAERISAERPELEEMGTSIASQGSRDCLGRFRVKYR